MQDESYEIKVTMTKFSLEAFKRGGYIVGIVNEDLECKSFFAPMGDMASHEKLKRNKFDDPICWRWMWRQGFVFCRWDPRPFTPKMQDAVYEHLRKTYGLDIK